MKELPVQGSWLLAFALGPVFALASALGGCTPNIGASCVLSTDCESDGTRICDTAEPGGYCTILNCTGNNLGSTCPENSFCVLFNPNVPGCPFSAREPSRTGQAECRSECNVDSDCRNGYLCSIPTAEPWAGEILDPDQTLKACLPALGFVDGGIGHVYYGYVGAPDAVPPVCQAAGPTFDAGFPTLDAGADADAGELTPLPDAGDAGPDAAVTLPDSGAPDSGLPDAGHDAATDAPKDSTVPIHDATIRG